MEKMYFLLESTYYQLGRHRYDQVQHEVTRLHSVNAIERRVSGFEVKNFQLKPLPIIGMFYRWGVDLCKMPVTHVQ